jgi:hypothetical protein
VSEFPKILVCAPTASAKNYCFKEWIENVMNFTYPNFDIRLFDNTIDEGKNAHFLNHYVAENYGIESVGFDKKFFADNSLLNNIINDKDSVIERMSASHNDCRDTLLMNNYQFMLHLETDVFPQTDIIEQLLFSRKSVVGALYYRDEGKFRKLMVQSRIYRGFNSFTSLNFEPNDEVNFINGECREVASVGLGCVLIERNVFKKIKFRFEKGVNNHPDTYFSEDCFRNGIKIFANTSLTARHENKAWGVYGQDFK